MLSLRKWIERLTAGRHTPHVVRLALPDCPLDLATNDLDLVAKLIRYFGPLVDRSPNPPPAAIRVVALEGPEVHIDLPFEAKSPDPGKRRIKEESIDLADGRIVRKRLTGMHFLFGGAENFAVGPCTPNDNQIINFINNRYMQRCIAGGALLCHAAGVAQGTRGLAMAGFAGMGKSTLSLHTLALGHNFVSNDRLMLRRVARPSQAGPGSVEMLGIPKLPRVNPGTVLNNPALAPVMSTVEREAAARLPIEELWHLEQKYDIFLDDCFGPNRFQLAAEMSGLVMLNWRRDGGPLAIHRVDLAERPDLVDAFRKSLGLFYDGPDAAERERAQPYVEIMRGCPVFEFTGGVDFDAAAKACDRFLRTGAM